MIKINLAKRRKGAAGGAAGGGGLKGFDLTSIIERFKGGGGGEEGKKFDLKGPLPKAVIAVVACYLADDYLITLRTEELAKVDAEIAAVQAEKAAVDAKLAKIAGFEPVKKQLEEDEQAVRIKLEVVNKLLEDRNAPAKLMMQVAQAIPEEVWLNEIKYDKDGMKLAGGTPGYSQVSDFIKSLGGSPYLSDITLSGAQEATSEKKEERFQTFELTAKRRRAD